MIELENNDVGVEEDNTEKHDVFEGEPVAGGFLVAKDESEWKEHDEEALWDKEQAAAPLEDLSCKPFRISHIES